MNVIVKYMIKKNEILNQDIVKMKWIEQNELVYK